MHLFASGRLLAALVVLGAAPLAGAGPAAAQERLEASQLASVHFPEPSWAWAEDRDGAKRHTVATAADIFERSCGPTEFHAWQVADEAAGEALRQRTDAAFQAAGWTYSRSVPADPALAHLAESGERALVLVWVRRPEQDAEVLFLCEAQAAGAPAAQPAQTLAARAAGEPQPSAPAGSAAAAEEATVPVDAAQPASGGDASAGSTVLATGGAFALIGFFFAAGTIRNRRRADAAARWPRTLATVESSEVLKETGRDADGHLETHYTPVVRYSYEVGGQAYKGSRIRISELAFSRPKKAEEIVAKYPAGAQVGLRYDPVDPASALLETVKPGIMTAIIGGVMLAIGLVLSLAGLAAL